MPVECTRLHAAYLAMRAEPGETAFGALMEAFEADLKAGAYAFVPVQDAAPEAQKPEGGSVKWHCLETPRGRMLTLFTSRGEVERHAAPASVGVQLSSFVKTALRDARLAGILLNPMDGHRGVPIDRRNLETLAARLGGAAGGRMPLLHPAVIEQAVIGLFEVAVGVPTPVYDVMGDMGKLGGPDALLKPVLEKYAADVASGAFKRGGPEAYVVTVLRDVATRAFVAGVFVRKDPELARTADPDECLGKVSNLREDIVQNVDEYLVVLFGLVRLRMPGVPVEQLWALAAANVAPLGFGMACFGLGWGIAKYVAGLPEYEMQGLRKHEREFLEKLKVKRNEAQS